MKNTASELHRDREFYIDHDQIPLHAKLNFPGGELKTDRCPLLILLHGYTGHMEERHLLAINEAVTQMGWAVLRIELYGHGKSGGTFYEHTVLKWMSEMMTVIDYARNLDFVSSLYLAGHSQGGFVTAMAGAMKEDAVKSILLLSPALVIPEDSRAGHVLGTSFDPDHIPDSLQMEGGLLLSGNYMRAAKTVQIEPIMASFRKPVLIVHGDGDETVPVQCAINAAKIYRQAELALIPGDTHCYDRHLDQVTEVIVRYLEKIEKG